VPIRRDGYLDQRIMYMNDLQKVMYHIFQAQAGKAPDKLHEPHNPRRPDSISGVHRRLVSDQRFEIETNAISNPSRLAG
jgi:hypothetical protein